MAAPSDEELAAFLETFGVGSFRHADQVLPLLRSRPTEAVIKRSRAIPIEELRSTYRVRAELLAGRELRSTFPGTLPSDVTALADALDAAADQPVRIWSIQLPGGTSFMLFELTNAGTLAGIVQSTDQRIVNPQKWLPEKES